MEQLLKLISENVPSWTSSFDKTSQDFVDKEMDDKFRVYLPQLWGLRFELNAQKNTTKILLPSKLKRNDYIWANSKQNALPQASQTKPDVVCYKSRKLTQIFYRGWTLPVLSSILYIVV